MYFVAIAARVMREESMKRAIQLRSLAVLLLLVVSPLEWRGVSQTQASNPAAELDTFFRNFAGLTDEQIRDVHAGKAVATILESPTPDEVFVFGAVSINSTPERYLKQASDIDDLRKAPAYLALKKFSDPPQLSDLDGFALDERDIDELQHCKPGQCDVQLPSEAMEQFQRSVDWSAADRSEQVNRLARQMAFQALLRYQQGGNVALGTYRDKSHPTAVADTFVSMLREMKAVPAYLPELDQYLLNYPNRQSPAIQSQFYWEKINFGLKSTLRIVQAIVYRGSAPDGPAYAVAVKQIYASHYFETALDLTVCVRDSVQERTKGGFYLITVKGSQQAGLTGFKGSIVRKVAVDKTRSSLQQALATYKQKLESQSN
jgi:hypothetical protein